MKTNSCSSFIQEYITRSTWLVVEDHQVNLIRAHVKWQQTESGLGIHCLPNILDVPLGYSPLFIYSSHVQRRLHRKSDKEVFLKNKEER
jgi:hypothetical protein